MIRPSSAESAALVNIDLKINRVATFRVEYHFVECGVAAQFADGADTPASSETVSTWYSRSQPRGQRAGVHYLAQISQKPRFPRSAVTDRIRHSGRVHRRHPSILPSPRSQSPCRSSLPDIRHAVTASVRRISAATSLSTMHRPFSAASDTAGSVSAALQDGADGR